MQAVIFIFAASTDGWVGQGFWTKLGQGTCTRSL